MENVETIIKKHNARILNTENQKPDKSCNCTKKEKCPFKKQNISCRATGIIYKAEVKSGADCKYYIGLSEGEFKTRFNNHNSSFNLERKVNPTLLSGHVRSLKLANEAHSIEWSVIGRAKPITDGDAACRLCIREATAIAFADAKCMNKRNEVVNTCRHRRKFLLSSFSYNPD
jgi:hypothetical protein